MRILQKQLTSALFYPGEEQIQKLKCSAFTKPPPFLLARDKCTLLPRIHPRRDRPCMATFLIQLHEGYIKKWRDRSNSRLNQRAARRSTTDVPTRECRTNLRDVVCSETDIMTTASRMLTAPQVSKITHKTSWRTSSPANQQKTLFEKETRVNAPE